MGDHPSGLALFGAILIALMQRERSGRGAEISSSLLANGYWANAFYAQAALVGARVPVRPLRSHALNALTNHYCCRDGRWFILALLVGEERQWQRFLTAIERPDLASDERFESAEARHLNAAALTAVLDQVFAGRDWPAFRERLDAHRITVGPVATLDDLPHDPQPIAGGALMASPAADIPSDYLVDSPLHVASVAKRAPQRAPDLGEHNDEILAALDFSEAEIAALQAAGALVRSP